MNNLHKILVLFVLVLLTGCSIQTRDTTAPANAKETIKIGVVLPLTGPSSDGGNYVKNGLLLAQDELNKDQDLAYRYELLFQDSMYDPKTAVSAFRKLVDIDKVKYAIGAQGSSETLAITPIAEENKVILITPGSQSDKISQAGDYIFRTQVNTAQESPFLAEHIFKAIGSKPLGLLLLNTDYGESMINNFNPKFEAVGGKIAGIDHLEEKEYMEKYKAVYGSENEILSANGYDALKILSQCIEQEKSDVEKVNMCLYTIKEYAGASGVFSLDQNGDAVKHLIIKTVKDRTFIKLG